MYTVKGLALFITYVCHICGVNIVKIIEYLDFWIIFKTTNDVI